MAERNFFMDAAERSAAAQEMGDLVEELESVDHEERMVKLWRYALEAMN